MKSSTFIHSFTDTPSLYVDKLVEPNHYNIRVPIFSGYDEVQVRGLTFDEALGFLARFFLKSFMPRDTDCEVGRIEWTLAVYRVEGGTYYTIQRGGQFVDRMNFDEMLGFMAAYMLTGRELFGGFKTYEQWARSPWRRTEITALIGGPAA